MKHRWGPGRLRHCLRGGLAGRADGRRDALDGYLPVCGSCLFCTRAAEYGMEYIADRKFAAAVMILFSAVWLVTALAVCWDAASALRKHRNRKS